MIQLKYSSTSEELLLYRDQNEDIYIKTPSGDVFTLNTERVPGNSDLFISIDPNSVFILEEGQDFIPPFD